MTEPLKFQHVLTCNGDRSRPPGLRGHTCSCPVPKYDLQDGSVPLSAFASKEQKDEFIFRLTKAQRAKFNAWSEGLAAKYPGKRLADSFGAFCMFTLVPSMSGYTVKAQALGLSDEKVDLTEYDEYL